MKKLKYDTVSLAVWFISLTLGMIVFFYFPTGLSLAYLPVQLNAVTVFGSLGFLAQWFIIHLASFTGNSYQKQFDLFVVSSTVTFLLFLFSVTSPASIPIFIYCYLIFLAVNFIEGNHPNWLNRLKNKIWPQT